MAGLDFELPAVVPAGLVMFGVGRGAAPEELLGPAGLSPELLDDPDRPVPASVMLPLWRALLAKFPGEPITLQMAEQLDVEFFGLAGQLVRHAPTVRAGLERTLRYQRLYDPGLYTTLDEREGRATYGIGHVEEVRRFGVPVEFMAAASLRFLRQLLGERIGVLEAHLETQPLGDPQAYRDYFGGPVHFGRPHTALVIEARHIDRPIIGADPSVGRHLTAYAETLLRDQPVEPPTFGAQVRRALERLVTEGELDPDAVARALAVSTRTLQRRLAGEGTRFQSLCDEVRKEAALRLLRDPSRTIHEIAFVLGYEELPSFYRAFKRWTGETPAEARRKLS